MLAVADSSLREHVASVSSVSGGSITSAVTVGGFAQPSEDDSDPIGRRVRLLTRLVQSRTVRTQDLISNVWQIPFLIAMVVLALFAVPAWASLDNEMLLIAVTVTAGIIGFFVFSALPDSWYAVQSVVETLVAHSRGIPSARKGTTLADIAQDETRRIFCATDLSSGSHVYLMPEHVLSPGETGFRPNVYLADVVAASACFPGFKPIVFQRAELGLSGQPTTTDQPRRHRAARRLLVGLAGCFGLAGAVSAIAARILGPLDDGWADFGIALVVLLASGFVALLCAWALWVHDSLTLIDGGVCDNLGSAFALLSQDDQYERLSLLAGTDVPGLMLVVDASRPFALLDARWRWLGELIPLRLRGAQRTMLKLLGNANAVARKRIVEQLLKESGSGALVSIDDTPPPSDGVDWPSVVELAKRTPTTLDALDRWTVNVLLLQAYRLTQTALTAHGVEMTRVRSQAEINDLVETTTKEIKAVTGKGKGPYARQYVRVRRITKVIEIPAPMIFSIFCYWVLVLLFG